MRNLYRKRSATVGLACALLCASAHGALSDTVHPFASVSYSYDDNLFRLDDSVPGFGGQRSDRSHSVLAGVQLERPIGRQVLTGMFKVTRVSFDHFGNLDYNGKEFNAAWAWHLANHLEGHAGAEYSETLTSFTDFHTGERNIRTHWREYFDGSWGFHPSWRLRAGFWREKFNYDLADQLYNNHSEDVSEAGISYQPSSNSRVGLVLRHRKDSFPSHRVVQGVSIDDGYYQDEALLDVFWTLTPQTQVEMLAGSARRRHNFFTVRDSSGPNGRVSGTWQPTGKIKLSASGWREFSSVESIFVNSSINRGVSLTAGYDLAAKLHADASYRKENRDFGQVPGLLFTGSSTDRSRQSSLSVSYVPQNWLQLNASVYHENRHGTPLIGTGNYHANGVSLNVTTQF